ncbi:glycoside hydrolase family 13 protein [Haliovirga abyssi]|uniref:Oligo-1,6-glucosidase n=1 Tax=Haliovirga abyssi TaxID=2996794 RepID=A0AAU9DYB3_9FUSO|nr:alpha-glucosidase [Haliovirga abyssi]BDU51511.1 oligo-1,6-glucosidase [Haliovirga abyssi]
MKEKWWKEGVVYQIYPRSFKDSNGDGIGDLRGIIEKIDYIENLGVDIIWLNPVYKSPNDDNGYDISDYYNIMDEFGTMADWEELLDKLHKRGIKLIMDLVVNHTSDEHKWFVESRKSKDNPYRDYYIWRKGKENKEDGKEIEPNNWLSFFSGSAWKYDKTTDEYFMHLFTKKQPDLNWENENVRKEVYKMMTWWLDKGIDGFRMDVINLISKVDGLPDVPKVKGEKYSWGGDYFMNGPKVEEWFKEMNKEVLSKYDIMTVGECPGTTPQEGINFTAEENRELNMIFQFELMGIDSEIVKWNTKQFELKDIKRIIKKWQLVIEKGGWNSNYLMNHDQPRALSRFGDDKNYRKESAKMLATFTLTLPGTPYIYQGEEIGMVNVAFEKIDDYKDVETINYYNEMVFDKKENKEKIMKQIHQMSRDNSRTPMQWDDTENAGFTTGNSWIKLNPSYKEINVENDLKDENSIYNYYKKLIKIRKENKELIYGKYIEINVENEKVMSYILEKENSKILVVINFFGDNETLDLKGYEKELLISNYENSLEVELKPYEARIYKIK